MSKATRQFLEKLKGGEPPSLAETIKVAALSLRDVGGQIYDGFKPMFDHGRTEAANLLYSGQAHVMYMQGQKGIEQGQDQNRDQEQSKETPEGQRDLGREM